MDDDTDAHRRDHLAGLRAHNAAERARTIERIRSAIATLLAQKCPVSTTTIREACGLEYASYRRNPEALALFRKYSTQLAAKRRRGARSVGDRAASPAASADPLLRENKPKLVARVKDALAERDAATQRYHALLQEHTACAETILRLRAQLARYEEFLGRLRQEKEIQEHSC